YKDLNSRRDRANGLDHDAKRKREALRGELVGRAGAGIPPLIRHMSAGGLDDARAKAAALVRNAEQNAADPSVDRDAKRVMEIAAARCSMHFLTERNVSNLRVGP